MNNASRYVALPKRLEKNQPIYSRKITRASVRLLHPLVFCLGWIVGFMSAFESWGVPPPSKRGDFQPINRRLADMVKNQA